MFLDALLNLIFPPHCLGCERNTKNDAVICEKCLAIININQALFCGKCGARLPNNTKICHKDFPFILGAATSYKNEIAKNLIHNLKFKYVKVAAAPLADMLINYAESLDLPLEKFSVIPVPLSEKRLRERGFNQSELIARAFAEHFRLPISTDALAREKHVRPQSETKTLAERRENVSDCFVVKNTTSIAGENIILIDDVITSGATMLEAAKTLKAAGARKIIAFAVAKA